MERRRCQARAIRKRGELTPVANRTSAVVGRKTADDFGWKIGDRVLRAAMVAVSAGSTN